MDLSSGIGNGQTVYSPEAIASGFGGNDSLVGAGEGGFGEQQSDSDGWWMCWKGAGTNGSGAIDYLHLESVDIKKPKRMIRHPIETGSTIVDHVVEDPWMADARAIIADENYASAGKFGDGYVAQLEKVLETAYHNKKLSNSMTFILGVVGGPIVMRDNKPVNFQLADYSCRVNKDRIGIYEYTIKLQEIMTVERAKKVATMPQDADTVKG